VQREKAAMKTRGEKGKTERAVRRSRLPEGKAALVTGAN
jgi:hypothetical protein